MITFENIGNKNNFHNFHTSGGILTTDHKILKNTKSNKDILKINDNVDPCNVSLLVQGYL